MKLQLTEGGPFVDVEDDHWLVTEDNGKNFNQLHLVDFLAQYQLAKSDLNYGTGRWRHWFIVEPKKEENDTADTV